MAPHFELFGSDESGVSFNQPTYRASVLDGGRTLVAQEEPVGGEMHDAVSRSEPLHRFLAGIAADKQLRMFLVDGSETPPQLRQVLRLPPGSGQDFELK